MKDEKKINLDGAAEDFVKFLQDSANKETLMNLFIDSYQKVENDRILDFEAKFLHEREIDTQGAEPGHIPGNITSILAPAFNMKDPEKTVARSIEATKRNLDRKIEERTEEINRLLAGIGGFSSQLKSCFARSTVVYFEEEDPQYSYRERIVFSIHLPNYELKGFKGEQTDEAGRTSIQATWDDAVNGLAKIVESSGLKAKYCKNDKNYGQYTIKQDLRAGGELPDEYFSIILDYMTEEKIIETAKAYNKVVKNYDEKIAKLEKKLNKCSTQSIKYQLLKKKYSAMVQEKNFFVGTVPDPGQIGEGLLLYIDVSTLKDYHIVRDKMQSIMTKFVLHLSKVATEEAEFDPDLEYELWKSSGGRKKTNKDDQELVKDVENGQIYVVDEKDLRPYVEKKKSA